jgi:hypothetical protein
MRSGSGGGVNVMRFVDDVGVEHGGILGKRDAAIQGGHPIGCRQAGKNQSIRKKTCSSAEA